MTIDDFTKKDSFNSYTSKERFWFENDKVKFWYRIYLNAHEKEEWGNGVYHTQYQVLLVVDDESIHDNHKDTRFKEYTCGFILKEIEKRGNFSEEQFEKVLDSALKIKIENKIKVEKYQKILGIVNGTNYMVN